MTTYMLDTCICSYIMRERPVAVLERLASEVDRHNRIVVSAITYAEMRYGQIGRKASAVGVKSELSRAGQPIGPNDIAIAGHAIAADCILVTNNAREFARVDGLSWEDWVVLSSLKS